MNVYHFLWHEILTNIVEPFIKGHTMSERKVKVKVYKTG